MDINDYFTSQELNPEGTTPEGSANTPSSSIVGDLVNEWTTFEGGNPYAPQAMDAANEEKLKTDRKLLGRLSAEGYNPNGSFGTENVADFFQMADIARSADPRDKITKFGQYFPDGEIRMESINGKNVLLARRKTDPMWTKFDEGWGGFVGESASAAEVGAFAGEVAGTALGGGLASIVTGPVGSGLGYVLGTVVDKSIERLRGYNKNIPLSPTSEDIFTGTLGAGISFLGRPVQYGAKKFGEYLSGIDVVPQTEEIKNAIQFAMDNNLPLPTVGSTALGGFQKAQYKQFLALGSSGFDAAMQRPIAARKELLDMIEKYGIDNVAPDAIDDILARTARDIDGTLAGIRAGNIDINDAGKTLDGLFDNWDKVNSTRIDALYDSFRKTYGDDISFDLTSIKDRKTGKVYNLQDEVKKIITGNTLKGADKVVPTGLLDASGNPITKTISEPVKVSLEPDGKLGKLMDAILKLDPEVSPYTTKAGGTTTAFDAVKELRSQFRRLMQSNDPQEAFLAGEMHDKMNDVIDSVVVNHPDPAKTIEALDAWKNMSTEYKTFMETKDISMVHKLDTMDATQRADVASSLIRPGRYESVKLVSELLGTNGKDTLRSMFFSRLTAGERLGSWENHVSKIFDDFAKRGDNKTIEYLFTPYEIADMKAWGVARDKLEKSSLRNYTADTTAAANAINLATSGDVAALKELTMLTATSPEKMDSVRAGFIQHLVDASSVQVPKYGQQMTVKKYDAILENFKNNGTLEVLFPDEQQRKFLTQGLRDYIAITGDVSSLGNSLQIAEQASRAAQTVVSAPEAIVTGNESKALRLLYKTATMALPNKVLGRFFLNEAQLQGAGTRNRAASLAGKAFTVSSKITDVTKKLMQFSIYNDSVRKESEKQNQQYSPAALNESIGLSPTLF
jgi:hypothetical protein